MSPNSNPNFRLWLQSPVEDGKPDHYATISNQLQKANIQCLWGSPPPENSTVLLILDDRTPEENLENYLHSVQHSAQHIIALNLEERSAPFYRVWQLLGMGVDDVLNIQQSYELGRILQARLKRWEIIQKVIDSPIVKDKLIGSSPVWQKTLRRLVEIALFSQTPTLILGESGTGKELLARLVHDLDKRPDKQALILLDCTTIMTELSGSEFFGHEKGAFTSAVSNRDGAFSLADRGTLFLDEIGELPLRLQAELLRVIQDGTYKRVGSNIWNKTRFRLVCATNRNLADEVNRGSFRQDLYYRLATCVVQLPPLRDRKLDIPELTDKFLQEALQTNTSPVLDPYVLNYLMTQDYPGNVRQLRQIIQRIAYRYTGSGVITLGDLPEADRAAVCFGKNSWQENGFRDAVRQALANGVGLKDIKRIAGDVAMDIAIAEASGNPQEAARRLDVSDRLVQGFLAEKRG